jgi:hypothetical protein
MADGDRPDLKELRRKLTILVSVIVVCVVTLVATTFYLYAQYSSGVRVTP